MISLAAAEDDILISVQYDATGLASATMTDNALLGWIVLDTYVAASRTPPGGRLSGEGQPVAGTPSPPVPVIVGTLAPLAPDTSPIISPQWAAVQGSFVTVADQWRGDLDQFFTWLSTNSGARRRLRGNFLSELAGTRWVAWMAGNPDLVYR